MKGGDLDPDLLDGAPSDFFELLGLGDDATAKDVKRRYRLTGRPGAY